MEVWRLPISASQRGKLQSAGYTSFSSLSSVSPSELARDLKISDGEAHAILKAASHSTDPDNSDESHAIVNGGQTAWEMLNEELLPRITTSSTDLDDILGGGISCKEVTEIGGAPGIGKTQLGIQLAVNVQIPVDCGGLGGKAIYIDTEGSFFCERAFQIAEALTQNLSKHYGHQRTVLQASQILENIFYFRVCSYTEQIALVNNLDKFISENKDVKVVILDSVTFHFRQDFDDLALRTRVLSGMSLKLMKLAKKFSLAVVLLNQVTTKYKDGSLQLTLALGDSWAHSCTNRIILYWEDDQRHAYIDKSPSLRSASAPYSVTKEGIRNSSSTSKRAKMT